MSEAQLRSCLATAPRTRAGLTFGVNEPGACSEPPFDVDPPRWNWWSWPWTRWPLLDRVALDRDRARVLRWYQARGFHSAEVLSVEVEPAQALEHDTLPAEGDPGCDRRRGSQGCRAEVTITISEGPPTLIEEVVVAGLQELDAELRAEVKQSIAVHRGERFDEALYDQSKQKMRDALGNAGYALAEVEGNARVDRVGQKAWVYFTVRPGPVCAFGRVVVEGNENMPSAPIRAATKIRRGARYSFDEIVDAQRAVLALGSFSAVTVEPMLPEPADENQAGKDSANKARASKDNVVDVRVKVQPARESSFGFGFGVQSGVLQTATESISVPQWDVHLVGRYQHKNLFGGLRQLSLEEKPRIIVQEPFPGFERPRFGNTISAELRQPGFLEPRTTGIVDSSHTFGPDPYDTFFRHRLDTGLGVERTFFRGKLYVLTGIRNSWYRVPSGENRFDGSEPPANSILTFLEQVVRLDFRDHVHRPHAGAMFQLTSHEAGFFLPSSWNYVRLLPDARVYVPLPAAITLAGRFALGMYFVRSADSDLDAFSQNLGPRDYRLRGGGASSNRGFLPGRLGDGLEGGIRRWEASLELRVPVTTDLGLVLFGDMGDVHRNASFRFDHPQAATGFGVRYFTIVGAIRLDFAWTIPGLQVLAESDARTIDLDAAGQPRSRGGRFVFHITIGEAF